MNIRRIMQQAAAAARTWRIKPVPGALALFEHGQPKIFLGIPINELFPETGAVRRWLSTAQDEAADETWNQMFHGGNLAPNREAKIQGFSKFGMARRMRKKFTDFGSPYQGIDPDKIKIWRDVPGEKFPVTFAVDEYGALTTESGGRHRIINAIKQGYERVEVRVNRGHGPVKTTIDAKFLARQMGVTEESLLETDAQQYYRAGGGMPRAPITSEAAAARARAADVAGLEYNAARDLVEASHLAPSRTAAIKGFRESGISKVLRKALTSFGSPWRGPGEEKVVRDTFERVVGRNFQIDQEAIDQLWETAKPFVRTEQVSFLGGGQEHMVFDLGEKSIIKIGYGKSLPIPKENEFLQAHRTADIVTEGTSYRGGVHAHVMPKVETSGITFEEQRSATEALRAKGWAIDTAEGNFGRVGKYVKVIDHGQMTRIAEHVMDTGEGAAIAKAGTAEVPAILKATSRIIKNAL